jgi:hypothetical protein
MIPLPEPLYLSVRLGLVKAERVYTESQVRAYAAARVEEERDRCLEWCRKVQAHHQGKPKNADELEQAFVDSEACGAEDCIEAICAEGDWP